MQIPIKPHLHPSHPRTWQHLLQHYSSADHLHPRPLRRRTPPCYEYNLSEPVEGAGAQQRVKGGPVALARDELDGLHEHAFDCEPVKV